jgi:hypothetical protein
MSLEVFDFFGRKSGDVAKLTGKGKNSLYDLQLLVGIFTTLLCDKEEREDRE